jgi:hypothetical protein
MKAITLFKPCLLACSLVAGAHAYAGPTTVNSIEFSFMSYSSIPSPFFSGSTGRSLDNVPTLLPEPVESQSGSGSGAAESLAGSVGTSQPAIAPVTEVYLPSLTQPQPTGTAPVTEVSQPAAAAAVIPEPGSLALLGLGFAAALLARRREDFHG